MSKNIEIQDLKYAFKGFKKSEIVVNNIIAFDQFAEINFKIEDILFKPFKNMKGSCSYYNYNTHE